MNALELIAAYERILAITGGMLEAARANDWERVEALERDCRSEVGQLVALGDAGPKLDEPLRLRKAQIIRDVLADDAEIRRMSEPWRAHLEQMIGQVRNERRLSQSYGDGT